MGLLKVYEQKQNWAIKQALAQSDLTKATSLCTDFLEREYGKDNKLALKIWLLRYYANNFISLDPDFWSPFDKNVKEVLKLHRDFFRPHLEVDYESIYFVGGYLRRLDELFFRYRAEQNGRKGVSDFLMWLEKNLETPKGDRMSFGGSISIHDC